MLHVAYATLYHAAFGKLFAVLQEELRKVEPSFSFFLVKTLSTTKIYEGVLLYETIRAISSATKL